MKKRSYYINNLKHLIKSTDYSLHDSLQFFKKYCFKNLTDSIEMHIVLNCKVTKLIHSLRTPYSLPYPFLKSQTLAIFSKAHELTTLNELDAEKIEADKLISLIKSNTRQINNVVTTPLNMPFLAKISKVLGPKRLMPSLKNGTITNNLVETIQLLKHGKTEYKSDLTGIIHLSVGKIWFLQKKLIENILYIYNLVIKNRPVTTKGNYIRAIYLCTTQSPSLKIKLETLNNSFI